MTNAMICPKGHESTEPDYCSECGARMGVAVQPAGRLDAAPQAPLGPAECPDCGTPRDAGGSVFCEICGYNFSSGAHGEVPVTEAPAYVPPPVSAPPAAPAPPAELEAEPLPAVPIQAAPVPATHGWMAEVSVDQDLHEPGSPEPPAGVGPFTFTIKDPVTLIGRKSVARAIFPDIPLSYDDAVSHRHALLQLAPEGTLALRDIGSSNGTRLNGTEIPAMADYPLAPGDTITLGHWSRIAIKAAS